MGFFWGQFLTGGKTTKTMRTAHRLCTGDTATCIIALQPGPAAQTLPTAVFWLWQRRITQERVAAWRALPRPPAAPKVWHCQCCSLALAEQQDTYLLQHVQHGLEPQPACQHNWLPWGRPAAAAWLLAWCGGSSGRQHASSPAFCESAGVRPWEDQASFVPFLVCLVKGHRLRCRNVSVVEGGCLSGGAGQMSPAQALQPDLLLPVPKGSMCTACRLTTGQQDCSTAEASWIHGICCLLCVSIAVPGIVGLW